MAIQEVKEMSHAAQTPLKSGVSQTEENDVNIYDALRGNLYVRNGYSRDNQEAECFENFLKDAKYDGDDDGKIDAGTGIKCFFSGILDNIKGKVSKVVEFAKEHPVLAAGAAVLAVGGGIFLGAAIPALVASEAISLTTAGLVQTGIGLAGAGFGLFKAVPAFKDGLNKFQNYKNATTDMEALEALHGMGSSSVDVAEGAAITFVGAKTAAKGLATVACGSEFGFLSRFRPKEFTEAQKQFNAVSNAVYENDANGIRQYTTEYYASQQVSNAEQAAFQSGKIYGGILGGLVGGNIYINDISESFK